MGTNLMSLARSGDQFLKLYGDRKMVRTLPYDAEVEYLENADGCYIDFEVNVAGGDFFEISGVATYLNSPGGRKTLFSSNVSKVVDASFYAYTSNRIIYASFIGGDSRKGGWGGTLNTKSRFVISTLGTTNNGVFNPLVRTITSFQILRFFSGYAGISEFGSSNCPFRCHELKIVRNEKTLYDCVPVRFTNSLGQTEGAMYDRVSGQLFRNAGTGAFIIGPDKTI